MLHTLWPRVTLLFAHCFSRSCFPPPLLLPTSIRFSLALFSSLYLTLLLRSRSFNFLLAAVKTCTYTVTLANCPVCVTLCMCWCDSANVHWCMCLCVAASVANCLTPLAKNAGKSAYEKREKGGNVEKHRE